VDPAEMRISTLAGLVTGLLGRIPHPGDNVRFNNITFTVEKVKRNRIETVVLTVEPLWSNGT
jgi:CBS domain containing-hemolysin-like protein